MVCLRGPACIVLGVISIFILVFYNIKLKFVKTQCKIKDNILTFKFDHKSIQSHTETYNSKLILLNIIVADMFVGQDNTSECGVLLIA